MRRMECLMVMIAALMATITAGCTSNPGNTGTSNNEIRYQPGAQCAPGDWNTFVPCPGDRMPTSCNREVQFCDPATGNLATSCSRFTDQSCGGTGVDLLPDTAPSMDGGSGDGGSGDGGTGCTDGTRRACTMTNGSLGAMTCSGGVFSACQAAGTMTTYPGPANAPCGGDARVNGAMPQACTVGLGVCQSTGVWACVNGTVMCNAPPTASPSTELCDNLDNDCDGMVDEGVTRTCYTGRPGSASVGLCRFGTNSCTAGVWSTTCDGEVTPTAEIPGNMLDEDCNGGDDSNGPCGGDTRIGQACSVGRGACMSNGAFACASNTSFSCSAMANMATTELCNNIDDDCDGVVDGTGTQPLIRTCYTGPMGTAGVGRCRAGTQTCATGAWDQGCMNEVVPTAEIPGNGIDEDCNGSDLPLVFCGNDSRIGQPCSVGTGACLRPGMWACLMNGSVGCTATPGMPVSESCNGQDDDCDGMTDEQIVESCYSGPPATVMTGVCHAGTRTCLANALWSACTGETLPTTEIPDNGIDEDCVGGDLMSSTCGRDPRIGTPCTNGRGVCARMGVYVCSGMQLSCNAVPAMPAAVDTCDSMDNDCDGVIDNNADMLCYSGPIGTASVGRCRAGLRVCSMGTLGACTGEILPIAEICGNAIDDDCDGAVDETCTPVDAGMPVDVVTTDASADAAPSDVVTSDVPPVTSARYRILGVTANCDTAPVYTQADVPGFTWYRVCWQAPAGTGSIPTEMSQHCDWTDSSPTGLPQFLPSQLVPAGQALHVLMDIRNLFPSGQACFNARLNGSPTQFVRGFDTSGGTTVVTTGTLRAFTNAGVELPLQNFVNGNCNGVNAHPIGHACPPYPTSMTGPACMALLASYPCT